MNPYMNYELTRDFDINGQFLIFARARDGWQVSLRISKLETIGNLKKKIVEIKYFSNEIKLTFHGELLDDAQTVKEYSIRDGSRIGIMEPVGRGVKIHIETVDRPTCCVDVDTDETVAVLKMKIHEKISLAPKEQRLWFEGESLDENARTLDECGIGPHSEIIAVSRLRRSWPIYISTIDGRRRTVAVDATETVDGLRRRIHEKLGIDRDEQILQFHGNILSADASLLADCGVGRYSVINVDLSRSALKLFIKTLAGTECTIRSCRGETVAELKSKIRDQLGICPNRQKLVFYGAIMEDARTLDEMRIINESTIYVVLGLRSGFKIFATTRDGKTVATEVMKRETVADLKIKIHEKIGISPEEQILEFEGERLLDDSITLGECGIQFKSVINVDIRLRPEMEIFLATMDGKRFSIRSGGWETILDMKKKIHEKIGLAPDEQKLVFQGSILEDARTVEDYQIREKSFINVIGRLRSALQIFIKFMDGRAIAVDVLKSEIVADLKRKIHEKTGILPTQQILEFQGRMLTDDAITLGECGISEKSTINCLIASKNK